MTKTEFKTLALQHGYVAEYSGKRKTFYLCPITDDALDYFEIRAVELLNSMGMKLGQP